MIHLCLPLPPPLVYAYEHVLKRDVTQERKDPVEVMTTGWGFFFWGGGELNTACLTLSLHRFSFSEEGGGERG